MNGFIKLDPDDLKSSAGADKLNTMLLALFNTAPGDGTTIQDLTGYGSPEGVITASIGSTYRQVDGVAGSSFYIKSTGSGNTGWVSVPSFPLSVANGGTGSTAGFPYIKVSEKQTSGTGGGNPVATTWTTRVLNTIDFDTTSISSLASNQITLPAGTYQIQATSPFFESGSCQIRLQNITASTTLLNGQNSHVGSATLSSCNAPLVGYFTLGVSSALAIQYYVNTSSTNGLGQNVSSGTTEVYTIAEFIKVA